MNSTEIVQVRGRQVWDSRGRPTVEAEVTVASGKSGRAIAPSGASKGSGEARGAVLGVTGKNCEIKLFFFCNFVTL